MTEAKDKPKDDIFDAWLNNPAPPFKLNKMNSRETSIWKMALDVLNSKNWARLIDSVLEHYKVTQSDIDRPNPRIFKLNKRLIRYTYSISDDNIVQVPYYDYYPKSKYPHWKKHLEIKVLFPVLLNDFISANYKIDTSNNPYTNFKKRVNDTWEEISNGKQIAITCGHCGSTNNYIKKSMTKRLLRIKMFHCRQCRVNNISKIEFNKLKKIANIKSKICDCTILDDIIHNGNTPYVAWAKKGIGG